MSLIIDSLWVENDVNTYEENRDSIIIVSTCSGGHPDCFTSDGLWTFTLMDGDAVLRIAHISDGSKTFPEKEYAVYFRRRKRDRNLCALSFSSVKVWAFGINYLPLWR